MKKAIVIGASSGIGRELSLLLSRSGYIVGATARRKNLLESLQGECEREIFTEFMDISNQDESVKILNQLIEKMNGVDLIIISAGVGYINKDLDLKKEQETININVAGFSAIATESFKYFSSQKSGHIVGISSVASIRGSDLAPSYFASKAYISNYLEGLRKKGVKDNLNIKVLDVLPGFVDTAMGQAEEAFWVSSVEKAAVQIFEAIKKNKKRVYVTKRWAIIGGLLKLMPDWLFCKI